MNFCPECGAKLTADNKFCPECGKKLSGDPSPLFNESDYSEKSVIINNSKNSKPNLAVWGALLSLFSLVLIYYLGTYDKSSPLYTLSFFTFLGGIILAILGFAIRKK